MAGGYAAKGVGQAALPSNLAEPIPAAWNKQQNDRHDLQTARTQAKSDYKRISLEPFENFSYAANEIDGRHAPEDRQNNPGQLAALCNPRHQKAIYCAQNQSNKEEHELNIASAVRNPGPCDR
jgi:hypothetical protein